MERMRVVADESSSRREFVGVYRRSVTEVYSYLASRVGDRGTAEDLTQEVFMAGARRSADGEAVDLPWLIGVARHKLVDHWRALAREERKLELAHAQPVSEPGLPSSIDVGSAALALAGLNPTYRAALVLRHVDELSVSAVAAQLGRSVEATEQVLTRARAAFRSSYLERPHD